MFSVLKKVFGGVVVVSVVISSCFGESDEGSALIEECASIEECANRLAERGRNPKFEEECRAGDKKACQIPELEDKIWAKCEKENDTQFCMKVAKRFSNVRFYRLACLDDNIEACLKAEYYDFACETLNHADTCYKIAKGEVIYSKFAQQHRHSKFFYEKACELKISAACNDIGVAYETGAYQKVGRKGDKAVSKNYVTAKSWYDKACALGDKKGCENAKRLAKEKGL